jgi:hypothetical protein
MHPDDFYDSEEADDTLCTPEECAYCGEPFDVGARPIKTSNGYYCSPKCKRRDEAKIDDMIAYESMVANAEPLPSSDLMHEVESTDLENDWYA